MSRLLLAVFQLQNKKSDASKQSAHITYCLNAMTKFEDHVRANSFSGSKMISIISHHVYNFQVSYIAVAAMGVEAGRLGFGYPSESHYFLISIV